METEQNNPHHCWSVGEHTLHALPFVEAQKALRLAVLLHDIGKPLTRTTDAEGIDHFYGHAEKGAELAGRIMRRLKFDNDTRKRVVKLVQDSRRSADRNDTKKRTPGCSPDRGRGVSGLS